MVAGGTGFLEAAIPLGNPCQSCGACCATYRVSFYCGEVDSLPGGIVPSGLVEDLTPVMSCMRGTSHQPPRCVALRGEIGSQVSCAIYEFRPSPCREFAPLASVGVGDDACNAARRRHGLTPLELAK
ncbi:MAG: YkgJ family cysteine cluster protein [Rhodocyclaceae bacterium]|nr:YkgJ family cysteine cluster protein [Rhodocyclaceae bacterium]